VTDKIPVPTAPKKSPNPVAQKRGKASKVKGQVFERLITNRFKEVFPGARRGIGQARSAKEVSDVDGTPFWIEAKHRKIVNVQKAFEQACKDTDGRPAIVVWRKQQGTILVSTSVQTFLDWFINSTLHLSKVPAVLIHVELSEFLTLLADCPNGIETS